MLNKMALHVELALGHAGCRYLWLNSDLTLTCGSQSSWSYP